MFAKHSRRAPTYEYSIQHSIYMIEALRLVCIPSLVRDTLVEFEHWATSEKLFLSWDIYLQSKCFVYYSNTSWVSRSHISPTLRGERVLHCFLRKSLCVQTIQGPPRCFVSWLLALYLSLPQFGFGSWPGPSLDKLSKLGWKGIYFQIAKLYMCLILYYIYYYCYWKSFLVYTCTYVSLRLLGYPNVV